MSTACAACHRVPSERADRDRLRLALTERLREHGLAAQLSRRELEDHARGVLTATGADLAWLGWAMVILNSLSWVEGFTAIPPDRRLLLLPQCLKDEQHCPAPVDALGLLCQGCGRCAIHRLKTQAEALGSMVLISEGTAAVLSLVQSGKIAGFVGSSCLSTLEKVFPVMSLIAVPAIAIPLLADGCSRTALDEDWLAEMIALGT